MSDEVVLKDEPGRTIVRLGDRVYRRAESWTPSVQALLRHLESIGFRYSARVVGVDEEGREVLTYIPGQSGAQGWAEVVDDAGLIAFARLLRAYHDAARTFEPAVDAARALTDDPLCADEIVCHNDFGPWNVVWARGGGPLASSTGTSRGRGRPSTMLPTRSSI